MADAVSGVKTAVATSAATITTGSATWLEWIPTDIGKLGTLVGCILTSVLIYVHLQKNARERYREELQNARDEELHEIEIAIKQKQLDSDTPKSR